MHDKLYSNEQGSGDRERGQLALLCMRSKPALFGGCLISAPRGQTDTEKEIDKNWSSLIVEKNTLTSDLRIDALVI